MKRFLPKSLKSHFCIVLLSAIVCASKSGAGPRPTMEQFFRSCGYGSVEFEPDRGETFLLDATLAKKKVKLMVDTGAPVTMIDPRSAPGVKTLGELHLKLKDSQLGEVASPSVLLIPDLALGPLHFYNQPARGEKLEQDYVALDFGGVLGMDFLARNFCIIDCGHHRIYFRSSRPTPELEAVIEKAFRQSGFSSIPAATTGERMIISGQIGDYHTDWILDTGDGYTFLEESALSDLHLHRVESRRTGSHLLSNIEGRVLGLQRIGVGTHRITAALIPDLTLGQLTWKGCYVGIVDLKISDIKSSPPLSPDVRGIFGADYLIADRCLIDFSTQRLWFPPLAK